MAARWVAAVLLRACWQTCCARQCQTHCWRLLLLLLLQSGFAAAAAAGVQLVLAAGLQKQQFDLQFGQQAAHEVYASHCQADIQIFCCVSWL
jgi:hypothetical protein